MATVNTARFSIRLSRLLLLLIALELLTMPLTQLLWTWDGFLHGGQDFELGLFAIVSCLCLVLLRAQHGRQKLRQMLAVCRFRFGALVSRPAFRLMRDRLCIPVTLSCCPGPLPLRSVPLLI
jgi:hypothetical protein